MEPPFLCGRNGARSVGKYSAVDKTLNSGHQGPGPEKVGLPRQALTPRGRHQHRFLRHGRPLLPTLVSGPVIGAGTGQHGSQRSTRTSLSGTRPRHTRESDQPININGRCLPHLRRGQTLAVVADASRLMLLHIRTTVLTTKRSVCGRHIWMHSSGPRLSVRRGGKHRKQNGSRLRPPSEQRKISLRLPRLERRGLRLLR